LLTLVLVGGSGCWRIPFLKTKEGTGLPPMVVERFAREASALGAPGAPSLASVTRTMASAVDTLPSVARVAALSSQIRAQAEAMARQPSIDADLARPALDGALLALRRATPRVSQEVRDQAIASAQRALDQLAPREPASVARAYRAVAEAMLRVTGGPATATDLDALVARFAAAELDDSRGLGAEVVVALLEAAQALARPSARAGVEAPRRRVARLAAAAPLDYAGELKEALAKVVASLDESDLPSGSRGLIDEAHRAVEAIRIDRPFDLQRAIAQDAIRLLADAIVVAQRSASRP
jgi:hypothetical protein